MVLGDETACVDFASGKVTKKGTGKKSSLQERVALHPLLTQASKHIDQNDPARQVD